MRFQFQILRAPDGSSESLIERGAMATSRLSMVDHMRDFDGSIVVHEFTVDGIDRVAIWATARVVFEAFRVGIEQPKET